MYITAVKDKGVTVVTVATDSKKMFPPLCQILKTLCFSPMCCSVHKGLMQTDVTAALGTIQIMVGLFNIGLEPGRTYVFPWDLASMGAAYWLGVVFIISGIVSLLAGRFPSLCLVGFAVFVNTFGSVFAIIGIVLNASDLAAAPATKMCDWSRYKGLYYDDDNCTYVSFFFQRLLTAMDITMIVLAVLQLCVCVSLTVLGIKAVAKMKKEEGGKDVEDEQLEEVLMTSTWA